MIPLDILTFLDLEVGWQRNMGAVYCFLCQQLNQYVILK